MRGLPTLHLLDEGFAIQRFPGEDEPKYLVTVIQHRIEARERGRVKTWPRYHLVGPGVRPIQLFTDARFSSAAVRRSTERIAAFTSPTAMTVRTGNNRHSQP